MITAITSPMTGKENPAINPVANPNAQNNAFTKTHFTNLKFSSYEIVI